MVICRTVSGTSTAFSFRDGSANVLSIFHMLHIRFVRYTSVTRTFVDPSLSVTCLVRMRSLRLSRQSSRPLIRIPSLDKHFIAFFLSVRRPLPLSVYI